VGRYPGTKRADEIEETPVKNLDSSLRRSESKGKEKGCWEGGEIVGGVSSRSRDDAGIRRLHASRDGLGRRDWNAGCVRGSHGG